MCAIGGIVDLYYDEQIADDMLATMRRRGPDEADTYCAPDLCLLHARLSVIDIEKGKQPMLIQWGGEEYIICYNGELYNTIEVRKELEVLGHRFLTRSDTEVILHGYAQWKNGVLEKLNGIFGMIIWEKNRKRLFMARDRMGVKPLFFSQHRKGLLVASEMKTILAYPSFDAQLDTVGAAELLLLGPGRTPGSGVFHNIYEIQPGCYGYYEDGAVMIHRYWYLKDWEHRDSFEDTVQTVRYLVKDSIQRQMVSDVPLGCFLSGGLDSSIISAICAKEYKKQGNAIDTFSLDYLDNHLYFKPGKFQPESDSTYIHIMEDTIKCIPHWSVLTSEMLVQQIESATVARDLPGMADVDFSLLCFCEDVRKHVKVALSGECADEIFGGYPWFRDPEVRDLNGFPWAQNTKQRKQFLHPSLSERIDAEEFVNERYYQTIRECDILPGRSKDEQRTKEMVNLNIRWFMQTLLDRKDRMSMYHGLEVRVPFCDYRIAEYLYGVPWQFKEYKGREKGLLRIAMSGILPEEILWRKKSPYPKTYDPRYYQLVSGELDRLLARKDAPIYQIVSKSALEQLSNTEYAWPWYGQLMRVPQTIAYMLQINCWMEKYRVSVID